ncbi:GEVED domain-containing protein [Emticicia sp. BO119]|uniref:GEVED domain-containing protein n=1 Tax=Emticicia sp. BO119 TaxID=2757768 RepID=UPI0015EFEB24|nr:GEVED domain-containing protein [Emticicia sp. BO119]MBA4853856.1 T9SS type A sorting domain-containing protein [Emticicia sp. BO119]
MKKLFFLLALFLFVFKSSAQITPDNWCTTIPPTQNEKGIFLQKFQSAEIGKARKGAEIITNVALKIHLVSKSDGNKELSDSDINELMDTLNLHFIDAKIQFYLCGGINYINDDASYKFNTQTENAFCKTQEVTNAVNLYLVKEFADPNLGGYAYFPNSNKATNRIFCAYKNRHDLITKILPHEMGHYFGLLHTFQDAGGGNYSELVTREEKANCAYRGDLICDTPADPYGSISFSINNCEFISDITDANGDYYKPQIGNLMSYFRGCGNFFTPGQISMIKTGLLIRTIQSTNATEAYSIDCEGVHSTTIIAGDLYLNGVRKSQGEPIEICLETPFTVKFSSNGQFKPDNEFKAYLIAVDNTFSTEVGKGTGNEIICKIPKNTPLGLRSYRLQVSSSSPAISGTLSNYYIYPNSLPILELSGSFDIFENEGVEVPMKLSGGTASIKFSDNFWTAQLWSSIDPYFYFYAEKNKIVTAERVWNQCGEGIGKGQIQLNVVPKPSATSFTIENISGAYLCQGKPFKLNIKANGLFNSANKFTIQLSDKTGGNFREIAQSLNPKNLIEFVVPEDLTEGNGYKIKVISSNPANTSISESLSVQSKVAAVLSGDTTINNGKNAYLNIQINGKTPITVITSEGDSIIGFTKTIIWKVSPAENKTFSLKSASNSTCGNGQVSGQAKVNVDYTLTISDIASAFVCVGGSIKVPYETSGSVSLKDGLLIQLSDSQGKNFRVIPGNGSISPLSAIIPEDTPEGSNYRLRVVSKNGAYISNESNEFEIRRKPSAFLEGVLSGNIGTTQYLNVKLTGGGPWTIPVNTGQSVFQFYATSTPAQIPVTINNNTTYTLNPVSNACGEGLSYGQAISQIRNSAVTYCIPQITATTEQYGRISRVRLTDTDGNMLLNNFEVATGKDNYTDNTAMVAYLKPGGTYNYDIASSDLGSETYLSAKVGYYLIMWIDYDQNGKFDKNEAIVESALQYSKAQFRIPDNAKKGVTRLRIRSYNETSSLLLDNPCTTTFSGETEDYTIFITDEIPAYTSHIKFAEIEEGALCKAKEYELPFTYTGTYSPANVFRVALYNSFGQFLTYLGESKTNLIKIRFPIDVPIGSNYKLKIISSEPYFEGTFTKAFRINDIPTAKLSGNQTVYFGQEIPLNLVLDGGSDWGYSIGPRAGGTGNVIHNKIIIDYPGHRTYMIPGPGIYNFTMNYVVNSGCGEGKFEGSARVEVLEPKNTPMITRVNTAFQYFAFNQAIFRCKDYDDPAHIYFETTGKFDKENFFTCHLIGPDDKFVAIVGYSKTKKLQIEIPENINGYGYKLRIVSSAPYSESPLSSAFIILPKLTSKISGYSEILPGGQGLIQLDLTGSEPWDLSLSDGTSISTNLPSQILKVSPPATQTYSIKRLQSKYCEGSTSGTATVKVLKPRASELKVQQPNEICIGGNIFLPFEANGSFREKNNFKVTLTDNSGNKFKDIETTLYNDSVLNFTIPINVPEGEGYRIKVVSTSPYLESETTKAFRLKPVSTATISSEVKSVYENANVRLRIDFTGEGPYSIELSDGRLYANIRQNPFFIDSKAILGINKYTIKHIGNSCGQGMAKGIVDLNVMPLPVITTQPLLVNTVCTGNKVFIPFRITNGEFQPDNIFTVDLYNINNSYRTLQTIMQGDSLYAIIPDNIPGGSYSVQVNGTNPTIKGSLSQARFTIKTYPVATIAGKSSIMEGDATNFQLVFSGDGPWTVALSNGMLFNDISSSIFSVGYAPQKSETLTISSIKNVCGEGISTGKASIIVHKLEEIENLVKIYPVPYQKETMLHIDEALIKNAVAYTITDILGRTITSRNEVSSTQIPIDLTFSAPGIYYVRITTSKKEFFRKIIK